MPLQCEVLGHTVMDDDVMLCLDPSDGDEFVGSLSTMPLRRVLQDGSCSSGSCSPGSGTAAPHASPQTDEIASAAPGISQSTPAEALGEAAEHAGDSSPPPHASVQPKGAKTTQGASRTVPDTSQQHRKSSRAGLSPATVRHTTSAWDDLDDDDLMVDLSAAGIGTRFPASANVPVIS